MKKEPRADQDPGRSPHRKDESSLRMDRRTFMRGVLATGAAMTAGIGCTPTPNCCTELTARASGSGVSSRGVNSSPPNLVFVFSDTHRNCDWSGGGNSLMQTPNLAGLAGQGVTFTNCVSNQPLCSPFRASLLTGKYPQMHGVTANVSPFGGGLSTVHTSLARILKNNGYTNGYVGKWHLYPGDIDSILVPAGLHRHGFDHYWRATHNMFLQSNVRTYDSDGNACSLCCPSPGDNYAPTCQTDMATGFIEANASRPFCLFLSWAPPHPPYWDAPDVFKGLYPTGSITARENVPSEKVTANLLLHMQGYYAHISALDAEMGRLLQKLDDLGIADNTIVVYASDHGNMLESHGWLDKEKPWEESINVPFVIRWPGGIPGGRELGELYSTVDIAPTLLGLMGFEAPVQAQGLDFSGLLSVGSGPDPESAFIMNIRPGKETTITEIGDWRGVRTRQYTYVKTVMSGAVTPWLLYDNLNDPFQKTNLVANPDYALIRQELEVLLTGRLSQVGDYFGA